MIKPVYKQDIVTDEDMENLAIAWQEVLETLKQLPEVYENLIAKFN